MFRNHSGHLLDKKVLGEEARNRKLPFVCLNTGAFLVMYICVQRDFDVYVVNAFDTGLAAKVLDFPGGCSLANVLQRLYGFTKDQAMARSNWASRLAL